MTIALLVQQGAADYRPFVQAAATAAAPGVAAVFPVAVGQPFVPWENEGSEVMAGAVASLALQPARSSRAATSARGLDIRVTSKRIRKMAFWGSGRTVPVRDGCRATRVPNLGYTRAIRQGF
jgi:hypothetical protein